jgi:hypothetical protein
MTFVVRGTRGENAATAVRPRADTAIAKARDFVLDGWQVCIDCPDGIQKHPDDFGNLLSGTRDDRAPPARQVENDLGVAV